FDVLAFVRAVEIARARDVPIDRLRLCELEIAFPIDRQRTERRVRVERRPRLARPYALVVVRLAEVFEYQTNRFGATPNVEIDDAGSRDRHCITSSRSG